MRSLILLICAMLGLLLSACADNSDREGPSVAETPAVTSADPVAEDSTGTDSMGHRANGERGEPGEDAEAPRRRWGFYPLSDCPVDGVELGSVDEPIVFDYHRRELKFCCAECLSKFEADPEPYLAQIDAAIIELQKPTYQLKTCFVSDELLIEGVAIDRVYNNFLLRFCCEECVAEFEANPRLYFRKMWNDRQQREEAANSLESQPEPEQPSAEPTPLKLDFSSVV